MNDRKGLKFLPLLAMLALAGGARAQQQDQPPAPSHGTVLFHRDDTMEPDASAPAPAVPAASAKPAPEMALTDAEHDAPTFTAYDLDVHLAPATAHIAVHAKLRIRNDGLQPLARLAMQLSSSLHWDEVSLRDAGAVVAASFAQQAIDTDADHTGLASEAVLTLPQPLAPKAEIDLEVFYSGTIPQNAERLERIGAPHPDAIAADWDAISPDSTTAATSLRGFGDVLWYPVAAPPLFLGDGAKLFDAVGRAKLRQSAAVVHLHLAVEYTGEPPVAAYFCGRREPLSAITEDANQPVAQAAGIATAEFAARPLGFRIPSLFLTGRSANVTGDGLIAAITDHEDALPAYAAAAKLVQPMLVDWLGSAPLSSLTVLDHPGQPFEDDDFLVAPMRALAPATLAPSLVHLLSHAWLGSSRPWMDEGVAQFMSLLWIERTQGREAAIENLEQSAQPLALAEPDLEDPQAQNPPVPQAQSLIAASSDIYYRTKAAAVFWMLRSLAGEVALKQALQAYRGHAALGSDPEAFEHELEQTAHKDLRWFFDDWVYRDRGLPDLTIAAVTPSEMTGQPGRDPTWLIAVVVRNDGAAAAEVPVTVRSGSFSATERLRVAGRSTGTIRISLAGRPEEIQVNDGSVPEMRTSTHSRQITVNSR